MSLSFAQAKQALIACVDAKITPLVVGPPGVGKTALFRSVALEVNLPCHELLASNCFGAETAFVTDRGVRRFADFHDGDRINVISHTGAVQAAIVRHFGQQSVFAVTLQRGTTGAPTAVRTTRNHRWHLADGTQTTDLQVGDRLASAPTMFSTFDFERASLEERHAWRAGFVWGDGATYVNHGKESGVRLRLCGKKVTYLNRFTRDGDFRVANVKGLEGDIIVTSLEHFKRLPDPDSTPLPILRAFVRGFVDADASKARKDRHVNTTRWHRLQVTGDASIKFVRTVFPAVGLYITGEVDMTGTATNYGARTAATVRFSLSENLDTVQAHHNAVWRVRAIEDLQQVDAVWCLEVEHDRSFLLPFGVVTGNCDAVDIAGLPYIVDGVLRRALISQIQACVEAPGLLFLDELTSVPPSVQAPLMRLLLEHYAGSTPLHPESCVVGAANRPEECPGGIEMSAASINRVIKIVDFMPTLDEIRAFFDSVGNPETRLHEEFLDFSATLSVNSDLLDMTPPRAAIDAGAPFASPRAWERGLRAYASYCAKAGVGFNVGKDEDDIGYAILSGAVGEAKAIAFLAIRKMRKHLPSIDDILRDPVKAKVPEQKDRQIAAVGLLARVADKDLWASWIYTERLLPEISAACARVLMTRVPQGASKWFQLGKKAQIDGLAKVRRAMQ